MSAGNFIIRHWKQQVQCARNNLGILRNELREEAIHDLRVSIKKIRSYARLYGLIKGDEEWVSQMEETEKLFSYLGKQRNVEVCIGLLPKIETDHILTLPGFNNYLNYLLSDLSVRSGNALRNYDDSDLKSLDKEFREYFSSFDNESLKVEVSNAVARKMKQIQDQNRNISANAHDVRKDVKDVFYWICICAKGTWMTEYETPLDKIQKTLGTWRDYIVLGSKSKIYRRECLSKFDEEYDSAKRLELILKEDCVKKLENARKLIKELG